MRDRVWEEVEVITKDIRGRVYLLDDRRVLYSCFNLGHGPGTCLSLLALAWSQSVSLYPVFMIVQCFSLQIDNVPEVSVILWGHLNL